MDNVTHALIGVALAVPFANKFSTKKKNAQASGALVRAAFLTSIFGNNIPDLDFVLPYLFGDGGNNLSYLLHHRGITHTVVAAPFLGLVSAWVAARLSRVSLLKNLWLWGLGVLACFFHVGADFWNNYGVHPFAPFYPKWFYGDSIFILEPLLWFALLPLAWRYSKSKVLKGLLGFLAVAVLFLVWGTGWVSFKVSAFVTAWALGMFWLQRKYNKLRWAVVPALLVLLVFVASSAVVKAKLQNLLATQWPDERVLQKIVSPEPSNPFCWSFVTVSRTEMVYKSRLGSVSLWPTVFAPERCFRRMNSERTAELKPIALKIDGVAWIGKFEAPLKEIKTQAENSCRVRDFLLFARAPYWQKWGNVPGVSVVGDLRYDREPGLGFSEFQIGPDNSCLKNTPFLIPPTLFM